MSHLMWLTLTINVWANADNYALLYGHITYVSAVRITLPYYFLGYTKYTTDQTVK